jgi:AcrR family transcriptional regulator
MADESTKNRIIEAAGPIFAEVGFEQATVREICRSAGVNVASIKYYFGDKKNLYLETVRYARQSRADRYPFPDWNDETPAAEKLYDFVSALLRRLMALDKAPWQVNLLMRELMKPDDACRLIVREHFQPMFAALLGTIDQLVQRPLAEDERLKIGFSIIGQCLHYRYGTEVMGMLVPSTERDSFRVEQVADHITRFCLNGLAGYQPDCPRLPSQDG